MTFIKADHSWLMTCLSVLQGLCLYAAGTILLYMFELSFKHMFFDLSEGEKQIIFEQGWVMIYALFTFGELLALWCAWRVWKIAWRYLHLSLEHEKK